MFKTTLLQRRSASLAAMVLTLVAAAPLTAADTALDRYVRKPDTTYKYDLLRTAPGQGYTTYVIALTSQTWRKAAEVDPPVWKHWLTIVKPDQVDGVTGYLFLTGGSVTAAAPEKPGATFVQTALLTHTVTAELRGIPNEPLQFADETGTRNEDGIIAYTWRKFLL